MSNDFVVHTENRVRYLTLNRPRTRNSLTPELARDSFQTKDFTRGIAAFLQKQNPVFNGD